MDHYNLYRTIYYLDSVLIVIFAIFQVYCARAANPALSAPPPSATPALLNSYLPAAMQVLAHLTHQMTFERPPAADPLPAMAARPTTSTTRAPATTKRSATTTRKAATTAKPIPRTTTAKATT